MLALSDEWVSAVCFFFCFFFPFTAVKKLVVLILEGVLDPSPHLYFFIHFFLIKLLFLLKENICGSYFGTLYEGDSLRSFSNCSLC